MISVIIPVYNNKSTIRETVKSVLAQEGVELEIICVDDGSSDGSGQILVEMSKEYPNVHVIRQENAGPGAARNRGIDEAKGEYIAFVDADDKLLEGALAALVQAIGDTDLAIAGLLWRRTFPNGEVREHDTMEALSKYAGVQKMPERFFDLFGANLINSMCAKLYKRKIIESYNVRVPLELDMGEDLQFNLRYLRHVSSLSVVSKNAYLYENDNSTLSARFREDMFEKRKLSVSMLREYLQSQGLSENICFFLYEKLLVSQTMQDIEHKASKATRIAHISAALATPEIQESIAQFRPQGTMQKAICTVVRSQKPWQITFFARISSIIRSLATDKVNRVSV